MSEAFTNQENSRTELISFRIGAQEFCVDVMSVREIRGWTATTPLPHAPNYVRGVINLRGVVLPVIDLGGRLGLSMTDPTARHVIIVTRIGNQIVGLLVDAVCDILTVSQNAIQTTPDLEYDTNKTFVRGLLPIDGRMISLITLENVLPAEAKAA
ncbi:MAG: chemotaxis protein CheW [Rhizobiales bacterium]|nr:chemotaxis protein CheW [Hyphomicrobiales bacterium]